MHTEKELNDSERVCMMGVGDDVEEGCHSRLNRRGVI